MVENIKEKENKLNCFKSIIENLQDASEVLQEEIEELETDLKNAKNNSECMFCNNDKAVMCKEFNELKICKKCAHRLKKISYHKTGFPDVNPWCKDSNYKPIRSYYEDDE